MRTHSHCSMLEPTGLTPNNTTGHKRLGTIVAAIAVFISLTVLAFLIMVGYYVWQIKFGDATKLEQTFRSAISLAEGLPISDAEATKQQINQTITPANPRFGNENAPVTVVAFIDFECPFCQAEYATFEQVMETYEPAVRFVFKHFPLQSIHPQSVDASLAAACADEQDRFWPYYDLLFTKKMFDRDALISYAQSLNLNTTAFTACLDTKKYATQVETDFNDGVSLGVRGTPTFFVNDKKIEGAATKQIWDTVILEELKK